jgi:hypothetical protein
MMEALLQKNTNGSRKVNMISYMLKGVGALIGGVSGGVTGGGFGAIGGGAVGAALGGALDTRGGSFLKAVIDYQTGAAKPFIRMEGIIKKTFDKVARIGSAIENKTKLSPRKLGESKSLIIFRILDSQGVNSREKYLDTHEKLEGFIHNRDRLMETIQEVAEDLNLVDMPQIGAVVSRKLAEMVNHAYETIPKPPPNLMPEEMKYWEPSSMELSEWFDRMTVMDDPFVAIDEMIAGTLTSPEMDTFKTIYPEIFQASQAEVLDTFLQGNVKIPYNQTLSMSLFMGMDLQSSLSSENIANNQAGYRAQEQQQQEQAQPRSSGGIPQSSTKKFTTKAQRLATL